MDPNYTVFANTLETYDAYFQDDRERYIHSYQEYEQYMALCEQEASGSGSGTGSRSSPKKRAYIPRQQETAEERLIEDYFGDEEIDPKYTEENFRRRYRMSSTLFKKIVNDILSYDAQPLPDYFQFFREGYDCTGRKSIGPILKCTSAIRQLAYGTAADAFDEYLQIGERTQRRCLVEFTKCIHILYVEKYLRKPTLVDIENLYALHEEKHGLPGMLGSIDCMHWDWKNCPKALAAQFKRRDHKYPTIMLEAVADQRLWIWHAYFGVPGANNDLNVLYGSPLFDDELAGTAPECPFEVNGHIYNKGYYLADGIYPTWSVFVKTFSVAKTEKTLKFKRIQESSRKDIERAFGVLQGRWGIIRQPARAFEINALKRIMYCCVMLHNMILEDEDFVVNLRDVFVDPTPDIPQEWTERCDLHVRKHKELRDSKVHNDLRDDLVEHVWNRNY
ncbi:ALP1-like protein [Tanacetum coccineum]